MKYILEHKLMSEKGYKNNIPACEFCFFGGDDAPVKCGDPYGEIVEADYNCLSGFAWVIVESGE